MATHEDFNDMDKLELVSTIGFAGNVPGGLLAHPDEKHLIYPLGNTIVMKNIKTGKQECLSGHTDRVSCVAISKSGKYVASGQSTHMGFKAAVIVWDFHAKELYCTLNLHKVKVEALAFSPNDKYLATLGGQDDGSVVIWDISRKDAVCGAPAAVLSAGTTYCVAFANNSNNIFVTGGNKTLRVWELDVQNRIIRPTDCSMGQLKRIVKCIQVSGDDKYIYCGTTSGDILQVNIKTKLLCHYGPLKEKFSLGVVSLQLIGNDEILLGAGDGTVALVKGESFKKTRSAKIEGEVTSLAMLNAQEFFCGTMVSQIYKFTFNNFANEVISTCHYGKVTDISFPYEYSNVFATCSKNNIRVWNAETSSELLRIVVQNMTCNAVDFMNDGKSIISGWDDGKIRAFTPQTGKLKYTIHDAHSKGVTSLATTSTSKCIISGGGEGEVRVWQVVNGCESKMIESMKEHKGMVTCIKVRSNDSQCVTASTDGTCIIWDLERFVRNQIIFANTMFRVVCYRPDECQIITAGTDRKIGCWECFDGSAIRELEGTKCGSINGMDISPDGKYFVTGGEDKLLKVWDYNKGEVSHVGIGHSGEITRLKICPFQKHIVSVSTDGAVLRWKFPFP